MRLENEVNMIGHHSHCGQVIKLAVARFYVFKYNATFPRRELSCCKPECHLVSRAG